MINVKIVGNMCGFEQTLLIIYKIREMSKYNRFMYKYDGNINF